MNEDSKDRRREGGHDSEEIEIIEVVGLDENEPPPSESEPEEVDVTFDESAEGSDRVAAVLQTPAAPPPSSIPSVTPGDLKERLLRLQADFDNFKKRMDRERNDYHRHATASLVSRLLPVIDNFERAMASEPQSEQEESFRKGVNLIHRQLMDELTREGLRPINAVGEPFDPNHHEAVATDASSTLPPNTVVEELQRGYFFQDRLLRPAAVRVSVATKQMTDAQAEEES